LSSGKSEEALGYKRHPQTSEQLPENNNKESYLKPSSTKHHIQIQTSLPTSIMSVENSQSGIDNEPEAGTQSQNRIETAQYFINKTAAFNIVKTTIQPDGQIIDWIPIESQGEVASPPPLPAPTFHPSHDTNAKVTSSTRRKSKFQSMATLVRQHRPNNQ
jgi:hypothetical protein